LQISAWNSTHRRSARASGFRAFGWMDGHRHAGAGRTASFESVTAPMAVLMGPLLPVMSICKRGATQAVSPLRCSVLKSYLWHRGHETRHF